MTDVPGGKVCRCRGGRNVPPKPRGRRPPRGAPAARASRFVRT